MINQLHSASIERETEASGLSGRQEKSSVHPLQLPAAAQQTSDPDDIPLDPVPQEFNAHDFLPDDDKPYAPPGNRATLPENLVLRFLLIKRTKGKLDEPWKIPDRVEFDRVINLSLIHI